MWMVVVQIKIFVINNLRKRRVLYNIFMGGIILKGSMGNCRVQSSNVFFGYYLYIFFGIRFFQFIELWRVSVWGIFFFKVLKDFFKVCIYVFYWDNLIRLFFCYWVYLVRVSWFFKVLELSLLECIEFIIDFLM